MPACEARVGARVRELCLEHRELLVYVPTLRHERALVPVDVRERAKAVVLQLEIPVRMIEWLSDGLLYDPDAPYARKPMEIVSYAELMPVTNQ